MKPAQFPYFELSEVSLMFILETAEAVLRSQSIFFHDLKKKIIHTSNSGLQNVEETSLIFSQIPQQFY